MDATRIPVIVSAARTPSGRFRGALSGLTATQLGAVAVRAAVERAGLPQPDDIHEVVMGNVVSAGVGQNPARQAAIFGGLPPTVGAYTVNKVCGSGLKAVMLAAQAIRAGDAQVLVAGGMESMSRAPYLLYGRLGELRFGHVQILDSLIHDGLWCAFEQWVMGDAAEFIADAFDISREEMDRFAYESHRKAMKATEDGAFRDEIVPVEVPQKKGQTRLVDQDESIRWDTSLEALAKLKPVFKPDGKVTAGNAPGLNDGASALVVTSLAYAEKHGLQPMARIVGYTHAAVEPKWIFRAPAVAIPKLLEQVGWSLDDVDLFEINEAFSSQILANAKELGLDMDRVNVHGGAIALGHPLGASGARILTTLLYALRRYDKRRGVAALCLGGGEAVALAVERMS